VSISVQKQCGTYDNKITIPTITKIEPHPIGITYPLMGTAPKHGLTNQIFQGFWSASWIALFALLQLSCLLRPRKKFPTPNP
jgi:hypothetical protein